MIFTVLCILNQADKWIRTVKKFFNTLQLSDEKKMNNVYGLMFDKADDWLARVKNLFGETLTWKFLEKSLLRSI